MATRTHAESKRLYSWWWNSHSIPKNSKWLQENLADMDVKVKSMIKLIEEDADSFRKRAEMYYRKRPELMKLVEEFYRAYRALAERYDHATGALRQAHRTMAEAFPDQIPLLPDESLSASSVPESGHHTLEYDSKDAFGISLQSDYSDAVMFDDEDSHKKVANGKARKGWNFVKLDVQEVEEKLNLKNQVTHASERANKAEIEVENLKIAISMLETEKKAVFIQQKLYQERISSLEADIMSRQEEVEKLNDEMLVGIAELKNAKDLCHLLEKRNQALQLDVDAFNVKAKKKEEELNMKQEELEKIKVSLKNESQRSMQLEELNCKSQEEVRLLGLEVQEWADKLKHAETRKVDLVEQIRWLKEEIAILNEQNCTYALKIIELQNEISLLEEFKRNHIEENKVLLQELSSIKADKRDLEQRHHELTEQIGVVNFGVESLQSVAKELRDGSLELKEIGKKNEVETFLHLENLKFMEKITVSNGLLETSLSNANAELEELREKVKTLEESCETLHGKISKHITEKAVLVSQIEVIARNFEILSKTNTLLENSLSDVNVELEGLEGMLNASEESCQSLRDQNIGLIAEKGALIAKVESISHNLKNLESRYTESEGNNLNLNREKDLVLDQVTELQHSLKLEKEEHESLMQTSKSQLAILEHQIYLLQEKGRLREEELDAEHHKIVHVQMEIFILQKYLSEMKEKNIIFAEKFQCKSELISNLELENSMQNERLSLLSQHNEMLVEGINQVRKTLNISKECSSPYDQHFKLILLKIEDLKASLVDAQDGNQHLILEKSVILTLLEQLVLDAARLMSQKDVFEQESKLRYEEVLVLQRESHQMLEINEQLKQHLQACNRREVVLKEEIETVCEQLADLHEAHSTLQSNFGRSFEVNGSLSKQINDLRVENDALELESNAFLAQRLDFEYLYLVFKSSNADRALELQLLHDNMDHLHKVNSSHEYEIRSLNEKLGAAQVENVNLKEVLLNTEKYKRRLVALENEAKTTRNTCELLSLQVEMGKNLVVQKDVEFQAVQDKNMQLSGTIRGLLMAIDDTKGEKEELENENHNLIKHNAEKDAEIAQLREANDALNQLLGQLFEETQELKNRDKCLTYELQNRNEEIESCEVEFEALLNDIQITINLTTFEEKMLDLLIKCESLDISAMIQKEMLYEQITRRTPFEDELKGKLDAVDGENRGGLKEELGAYLPLVLSLEDYVASLKGRIISLANQHSLSNQDQLDSPPSLHQQKSKEERTEDHFSISASGIFELQKLQARVSALEDVVIDIQDHLEQNRSIPNTSLLTTKTQNEELSMGKDIILHLKKKEKIGISEEKSDQSIKDIHLDHVLSSSRYDETKDQMMEMWETMVYGEKSESSSFTLASEKELANDKLELPVSNLEKSGSLSERLSADAQRLAHLHRIAKEIKRNMELSELSNSPTNFEFNKVKAQLKEAEGVISHLIDTNKKLRKKDVKLTNDFNDRMGNTSERKVTERAQRGSEKIGRLELELQKLECVWLKLKEEDDYKRARAADRRTRVLLWDYLYGRRENPGMKKVHCCACMRPRTKDD